LEKTKYRFGVGGSAPELPFASGAWGLRLQAPAVLLLSTITSLSGSFLALNAFYSPNTQEKNDHSKYCAFASFALLYLFFTSNSVVFVDGDGVAQEYFLPYSAGYPSYATARRWEKSINHDRLH